MTPLRLLFLLTLITLLVIPAVLVLLTFEDAPAVYRTDLINTEKAVRAKNFTGRTIRALTGHGNSGFIFITASEEDLNSLISVMARGLKRMKGEVKITQSELRVSVSIRMPHNPVGDFVNLHFGIYPSEAGLLLSPVTIGHINIPGKIARVAMRLMFDLVLGNDNGTVLMNSVQSVVLRQSSIICNLRRIPDLMEREDRIMQRLKILRGTIPLFSISDNETIRVYYARLAEVDNRIQKGQLVSLADFTGPLFELARSRSRGSEPAEENRAALLALAAYLGDSMFEKLTGLVRTGKMNLKKYGRRNVLLGGREDLRLHFVVSAGLKIVADTGVTDAVGEFKELLDARRGGSGFSFADLAADLSGTRLAEEATDSAGGAARIQAALSGRVSEDIFFPEISDLPEDISRTEFEHTYGNVENPGYLRVVETIKYRISQLPAYRR